MMNVKPCPTLPLPAPPVNVLLPLSLTPSPTKDSSFAASQPRVAVVRRRSSTFSAITRWALAVQPGSPPPNSPRYSPCGSPSFEARQTTISRRPSISAARGFARRRLSNSIAHGRAQPGSASFLHIIDTPTTAAHRSNPTPSSASKEFNFDLTNLGYNSVFVHLPYTPSTPSPYLARVANDTSVHAQTPVPPVPQSPLVTPKKGLKRFRSLGLLKPSRTRGKSVSAAIGTVAATATAVATTSSTRPRSPRSRSRSGSTSPSSPVHRVAMSSKVKTHRPKSKSISSPTTANMKKSKRFADAPPLPPTLASELLLMQFADGGSLESHAKRMMEKQARAIAPAGSSQASKKQPIAGAAEPLPLGTVFRDESGNVWWDEDEALEYKALLTPVSPDSPGKEWVTFNPNAKATALPAIAACVGDEDEERRGSVTSVSSTLSVSLNHLVTPAPADGSAYAMHLLRSSFSYTSPAPMSPLAIPNTVNTSLASASGAAARNKRTRRRPAPLKLHSSSAISHVNTFEDSFLPSPVAVAVASITPTRRRHRASTGRVSAPAHCTEFTSATRARRGAVDQDGDVIMKENENETEGSRERGIKKKSSKINLRVRAKALFGVA